MKTGKTNNKQQTKQINKIDKLPNMTTSMFDFRFKQKNERYFITQLCVFGESHYGWPRGRPGGQNFGRPSVFSFPP
jgi:hypothetical protein